jgi:acyl-CoA thioester hydrolase
MPSAHYLRLLGCIRWSCGVAKCLVLTARAPFQWDFQNPFTLHLVVAAEEIDEYQHVNNAAYVRWLDRCAWAHSSAVGISIDDCKRIDRGMAVRQSQLEYLAPAFLNDAISVATWITHSDDRLRVTRRFQVVAEASGKTLLRASIEYVCLALSSGRPVRMPLEFIERYRPTVARESD